MTVVIVGLVLMNAALYLVIPIQSMRESSTPIVVRIRLGRDQVVPFLD